MNYRGTVGIILATYNPNLTYFQQQIDSLIAQDYPYWICYIVDDCSTDTHQQLIRRVTAKDQRFRCVFYQNNVGTYRNFERGLELCKNNSDLWWIAFCDQDDLWLFNKLSTSISEIEKEKAILVHSNLIVIDGDNNILCHDCWQYEGRNPEKLTTDLLLIKNVVTGCSLLFRTKLIAQLLPFPQVEETNFYHDWWVALIAAANGKITHIRTPLIKYRQHQNNSVGAAKNVGKLDRELLIWMSNKFKITGNSYLAYESVQQAFLRRTNPSKLVSRHSIDFGYEFIYLWFYSIVNGYRVEGVTLRLFLLKYIKDIQKIWQLLNKQFSG